MYEQQDYTKYLKHKVYMRSKEIMIGKLELYLNCKIIKGYTYIEIYLRKIQIEKEIFVAKIEQGKEVFIPKDLRVNTYPKSFMFYDFILRLIHENISTEKMEFFSTQKAIALAFAQKENERSMIYRLTNSEQEKLTFSHS